MIDLGPGVIRITPNSLANQRSQGRWKLPANASTRIGCELVSSIKQALEDRVKDVRISSRLTDSPACLVADEDDIGGNLERILKSVGQDAPSFKPILEINPDHPIILSLKPDSDQLADWANVLFDQAALSEGAHLVEPAAYVKRVNNLLAGILPGGGSRIITDV